ncbi:hypothetical protein B0J13DRAFT_549766 [Dactylonectria estremocensis]|uniref:Zn(2)-C6 fungal-type domain-containing protein n=1 Tax=Dactylonectria estremocensis TaxID=1079267 RepID=A0A9P9J509_9HYPO|nr:hypothetical protein B0J13DRAFT_549766 [Dactylonectria estremocensis]
MKRTRFDSSADGVSRESAGPVPKISRKIRACQECQGRKIKCGLEPGQDRCARCVRLGLECVVNKSLQTLLDDENEWKESMELQVRNLQAALAEVQRHLNLAQAVPVQLPSSQQNLQISSHSPALPRRLVTQGSPAASSPLRPSDVTAMTRENSPEPLMHEAQDEDIGNAPMASLFEVTKLRNIRSDPGATVHQKTTLVPEPDFISQGKVSLNEAEGLFSTFCGTLNAYLWGGIALVHKTLAETRNSSTLLTAAILAVTALHAQDGGTAFDKCYPIFLELTSQSVFQRYHSLDDVRGLCLGAFWLSDVSWKLSGLAVRIATELKLHQFCAKALQGTSPEHVEKARLWYFLYVCDHHFSIAYGRPPVIHDDATITSHESLLQLPGITQADFRLHSQVGVFIILSRVFHTFGSDRSRLVANDEFGALRRYDVDLGHWRDHWESRLVPDHHISNYPAKGVILHYHFARLQLFSICLRGLNPSSQYLISSERRAFVNLAIQSATSALELILDDPDMRRSVIGVPLYLLTTLSYASMFLMKVQLHWKQADFSLRGDEVVLLIERTVILLNETRKCARHVAHYIGRGLNNMLQKVKERDRQDEQVTPSSDPALAVPWLETQRNGWQSTDWTGWAFDGDMMAHFDGVEHYPLNMLNLLHSQLPE